MYHKKQIGIRTNRPFLRQQALSIHTHVHT